MAGTPFASCPEVCPGQGSRWLGHFTLQIDTGYHQSARVSTLQTFAVSRLATADAGEPPFDLRYLSDAKGE